MPKKLLVYRDQENQLLEVYQKKLSSEAKVIQVETDTCSKVSAVIEFFQNQGFSATQVKKIIGQRPRFLASRVNKTIKPKLNFLQSVGFSEDECSKIIYGKPCILDRSIRNHLAPSFDFLKTFMGSKVRALVAIKNFPQILDCKVSHCWKQTVQILGQIGIADSQVSQFIQKSPIILTLNPQKMSEVGLRLKEMGFDVTSPAFRTAFASLSRVAHPKMERKFETYRSLGFSDDEILNIFRSQPNCMFYTEENIREIVAFYVDRLHFSLSLLSKRPNFLLCSLKRRLIPRCSVMQVLWSRGTVSEFGKLYPN
ncbi:transcription termination factor MTERF8, chloroplastic-like [Lycium ferocissimum]|uniref:transcription termination factor MTERF8, chloroplastic-like n=1 Tax=Lycium ferocissimum TaxID=112874 RepID=UPI002815291C|nr:transcription termination factor MTERF8, chloroplastic-like [Lycium ferocissimum]